MYMDYSMKRVKMFSIQFLTAPCCSGPDVYPSQSQAKTLNANVTKS